MWRVDGYYRNNETGLTASTPFLAYLVPYVNQLLVLLNQPREGRCRSVSSRELRNLNVTNAHPHSFSP